MKVYMIKEKYEAYLLEVENMGCVYKCHYISKEEFRMLIKWDHTYKHCPILIKQ